MKENLVRFGVAMESSLIEQLDALAAERSCNRSELLRDLTRAEVSRSALSGEVSAFAAVTLVYNHHVRELAERLTALQHDLGEQVRSSLHVHLNHEHCMEVIVMRGRSDRLKEITGRMIGTRGVIHGGAEYVAESALTLGSTGRRSHEQGGHTHSHATGDAPPVAQKKRRNTRARAVKKRAQKSAR